MCSVSLEAFRLLTLYLKPVLPQLAQGVETFLDTGVLTWADVARPLDANKTVRPYTHLMRRIEPAHIDALLAANRSSMPSSTGECFYTGQYCARGVSANTIAAPAQAAAASPIEPIITIDDFAKIDLRIAKIIDCRVVDGSKKLLQLTLDVGEAQPRNVFSGIRQAYTPEQLIGQYTVMVANLAPRKMKFGISEGMVLAASPAQGDGIYLLQPHQGAQVGMRIS